MSDIPRAAEETRTQWVCPVCDTFDPHFGAIDPFADELVYRCEECRGLFRAPEDNQ